LENGKIKSLSNFTAVLDTAQAPRKKAFKANNIIDQHSLARQTLPAQLADLYRRCDPPPRLGDLNPYREDGRDALKLYTDPGYFFELWRAEMLKECGGGGGGAVGDGGGPRTGFPCFFPRF
jgi:hypothetical protein